MKRALLLEHRLKDEVFAEVPHRQWVFTIPKRLRIYFRFDRALLGKLCRAAYNTVRDVCALEIDGDLGIPAMVGAVQTFGDLIHWHSHVHSIVADGVFMESGKKSKFKAALFPSGQRNYIKDTFIKASKTFSKYYVKVAAAVCRLHN